MKKLTSEQRVRIAQLRDLLMLLYPRAEELERDLTQDGNTWGYAEVGDVKEHVEDAIEALTEALS